MVANTNRQFAAYKESSEQQFETYKERQDKQYDDIKSMLLSMQGAAHGRLQRTDKTTIGVDGLALGTIYEVLIDVVLDKNVAFPRPLYKATNTNGEDEYVD
ncbi:hypothetical protein E2562_025296 [Oryza meyeriana var. granulata]|uniref:Uncharacterized protein n=1 Tax=Oryza meyeriana var. granulata TaxID=110450 RepID=A0A6G1EP97_9ORYZ|nr:hypothetical protein E2562_025296 [Oryza meyeriana var. granulata]